MTRHLTRHGGAGHAGANGVESPSDTGETMWRSYPIRFTALGWVCIGLAFVMLAVGVFLQPDDIELTPVHDHHLVVWAASAAGAAILAVIGFSQTLAKRWGGVYLFALLGAGDGWLLATEGAARLDMQADFPAAATRTFNGTMAVDHANTAARSTTSWNVETVGRVPVKLAISRADYVFMRTHAAGDGYFCAQLTFQNAGQAVRIVRGAQVLPAGTIAICHAAS